MRQRRYGQYGLNLLRGSAAGERPRYSQDRPGIGRGDLAKPIAGIGFVLDRSHCAARTRAPNRGPGASQKASGPGGSGARVALIRDERDVMRKE